ncbi:MAG: hypothetical protein ACK49L_07570 [Bacteroidota bacterium]
MKYSIIICLILIASSACGQINEECLSDLKTGMFMYPKFGSDVTIKRTKKRQIETYNDSKSVIYLGITWLSSQEYELKLIRAKGVESSFMKGEKLYVRIISCKDGLYEYECRSNSYGDHHGTIQKIR